LWFEAVERNPNGSALEETCEENAGEWQTELFQTEWDRFTRKELPKLRRSNPHIDYELACLIHYDYDCPQEDGRRRIASLEQVAANLALDDCEALEFAPKPEGWRRKRKSHPAFPKEWKHAIRDSWGDEVEALKDLQTWTIERRRKDFGIFYSQERKSWETRLKEEISIHRAESDQFRNYMEESLKASRTQIFRWDRTWETERDKEIEQKREQGMLQEYELGMALVRARKAGATPERLLEMYQKIQDSAAQLEKDVRKINKDWEELNKKMRIQAGFNAQAYTWLRPGPRSGSARLAEIKSRFSLELRKIEKLQAVEARELFSPT
jgi:hypothetical protein